MSSENKCVMWLEEDRSHPPKQCGFMGPEATIASEFFPMMALVASTSCSLSIMFRGLAGSSLTRPWQCIISHSDRKIFREYGIEPGSADSPGRWPRASAWLLILQQAHLLSRKVFCFVFYKTQEPRNSGQVEEANLERSSDLPKAVQLVNNMLEWPNTVMTRGHCFP